jgi:hypothetical protein
MVENCLDKRWFCKYFVQQANRADGHAPRQAETDVAEADLQIVPRVEFYGVPNHEAPYYACTPANVSYAFMFIAIFLSASHW